MVHGKIESITIDGKTFPVEPDPDGAKRLHPQLAPLRFKVELPRFVNSVTCRIEALGPDWAVVRSESGRPHYIKFTDVQAIKDYFNARVLGEFTMQEDGYYGVVYVDSATFEKLDAKFLTPGCTATVKYMRANHEEAAHLIGVGVDLNHVTCDWFKVVLGTQQHGV